MPTPPINNTKYGSLSLKSVTTGSNNSAFGCGSLRDNTTGLNNTAVGVSALLSNVDAICNTGIGADALHYNTVGIHNTSVGAGSMCNYATGDLNTAVGSSALEGKKNGDIADASGDGNVAIGAQALFNNLDSFNTAVGTYALLSTTKLSGSQGSDVDAMANTAIGAASLYSNTTGYYNCALGAASLQSNNTGIENTAIGAACLEQNTDGSGNVAVGNAALRYSSQGHANTAIGYHSIRDGGDGYENTAVGYQTLSNDQYNPPSIISRTSEPSPWFNIASGNPDDNQNVQVLFEEDPPSPFRNVALGYRAGFNNTNGSNNTYVGWKADCSENISIEKSTAIGSSAKVLHDHSTAIGADSVTTADNQIRLGIAADSISIPGKCDIVGACTAASFSSPSDERIKENVIPLDKSHAIDNLRPVTYLNKITNRQDIGLIAHELQKYFPMLVNGEKDGESIQTVNYTGLIAVLIHEIQLLKKRVAKLESSE